MVGFVRWLRFARFPVARTPADAGLFDRVDADALEVGEFRASGSMHFTAAPVGDFCDTVPAYAREVPLVNNTPVRPC